MCSSVVDPCSNTLSLHHLLSHCWCLVVAAHQPLRNFDIYCICVVVDPASALQHPLHLLLLQLQHLQLKSILNIESIVIIVIHLSLEFRVAASIYATTEASALMLTLPCATMHCFQHYIVLSSIFLQLDSASITLTSDCIYCHRFILLQNIVGPVEKVLIQEVDLLKNTTHL